MDAGINWIDTAPSYGKTQSEQALGWLLEEIDTSPICPPKSCSTLRRLDDIAGQVERSVHESLQRLRRESVDVLLLHNRSSQQRRAARLRWTRCCAPTVQLMRWSGCVKQGLTRYIGFTALGDAASCRQVVNSGRFDAAQVYYNLLNPSAARATMPGRWTRPGLRRLDRCLQGAGYGSDGDPRVRSRRARHR